MEGPARLGSMLYAMLLAAGLSGCGGIDASGRGGGGPLPFLRVEGNRFVDEEGEVVVLRGVSFSDPDRLEKAGQWNRAYFEAARSWNANVVRFPVHPRAWRERGPEAYLELLDRGIAWARSLGMYVILDWHSIGNLRTGRFQDPMYETSLAETFDFWETIADRYAGDPVVAFYELFNEPTSRGGAYGELTWAQHREMMEDLITRIYARDERVIPLVAGLDWGYDLTGVRDDPVDLPGVAYVTHPYPQKRSEPWPEQWEADWGFVAADHPVVVTEFGFMSADARGAHVPVVGDERYGQAIVAFLEERGISWTVWVFDPVWSPQLIEGWDFEPTRQGAFFRDRMRALNPPVVRGARAD